MSLETIKEALAAGRVLSMDERVFLLELMENTRSSRLVIDRQSSAYKKTEVECNALLVDQLSKHGGTIQLSQSVWRLSDRMDEPHVSDWPKLWEHIRATGDFSLLEKRPSSTAIKLMWSAGESVPGVEKYPVYKLVKGE